LKTFSYIVDYKFGVSFEFFAVGSLTRFDGIKTLNTLLAGVVLLKVCDVVVRFVALSVLPEKKVYKKMVEQDVDYSERVGRFAVNSALACQAFKTWNTHKSAHENPEDETLTEEEIAAVFEGPFSKEDAKTFAHVIHKTTRTERSGIRGRELTELLGDGVVDIKELIQYSKKLQSRASYLPLQEPGASVDSREKE